MITSAPARTNRSASLRRCAVRRSIRSRGCFDHRVFSAHVVTGDRDIGDFATARRVLYASAGLTITISRFLDVERCFAQSSRRLTIHLKERRSPCCGADPRPRETVRKKAEAYFTAYAMMGMEDCPASSNVLREVTTRPSSIGGTMTSTPLWRDVSAVRPRIRSVDRCPRARRRPAPAVTVIGNSQLQRSG